MKRNILGFYVAGIFGLALIMLGFFSLLPANSFTLDVNPSIEITTNRLSKVLAVKPLNREAESMLEGFSIKDKKLDGVVNDLVDLMILTGHISGGKDNLVMITVSDNNADPLLLDKVNQLIIAYLQNKQLEATILNQTIPYSKDDQKFAADHTISPGKWEVIKKIMAREDNLSLEQLTSVSLQEILATAEKLDFNPEELFGHIINGIAAQTEEKEKDGNAPAGREVDRGENQAGQQLIGMEKAIEIALDLTGGGEVVEFEQDEDRGRFEYEVEIVKDGKKYEVEIDAHTGKVLEFYEIKIGNHKGKGLGSEASGDAHDQGVQAGQDVGQDNLVVQQLIGWEKAKEIALDLTGGGEVVEFELEKEGSRFEYEIEIIQNGKKYEIEIDARTGEILEFEVDSRP